MTEWIFVLLIRGSYVGDGTSVLSERVTSYNECLQLHNFYANAHDNSYKISTKCIEVKKL